MLVSCCSDPRSAATSEHNAAGADADGAAALDEGLLADAGLPDALPLEQAATSSTRPERRRSRPARRPGVTLLIFRERAAGRPASPHPRRVIPPSSPALACSRAREQASAQTGYRLIATLLLAVLGLIELIGRPPARPEMAAHP